MKHTTGNISGFKALKLVYGAWLPDGAPKAIAIVVHGYGEHMGRYAHVIEALVQHDYVVYALDHRGHGTSAGLRGYVERFDYFIDDLHLLVEQAQRAYPRLQCFMVGHSMGGLIATRYALRHQSDLAGLVLSGAALWIGDGFSPLLVRVSGLLSRLVPTLPVTKTNSSPESVLSRDPLVQQRFNADPYTYKGKLRARMGNEMLRASTDARARMNELRLPLLVMHGEADTLTNPQGSKLLHERASSTDKTLRLWPGCRHEIFNEPEQAEVIGFMIDWLDHHVLQEEAVAAHEAIS